MMCDTICNLKHNYAYQSFIILRMHLCHPLLPFAGHVIQLHGCLLDSWWLVTFSCYALVALGLTMLFE